MMGGKLPRGFTIFEVMIVLAISGLLFFLAINTVTGAQSKAEFTQAVRDVETQLTDVANDVSNGYFPSNNGKCDVAGGFPRFVAGTVQQGANDKCIFIGKAVQFNKNSFDIYTLAGNKKNSSGQDITSLGDPDLKALANTTTVQTKKLLFGLQVDRISVMVDPSGGSCWNMGVTGRDNPTGNPQCYPNYQDYSPRPSTIMFITSFGKSIGGGKLAGSPQTNLYVLRGSRADSNTDGDATTPTIADLLTITGSEKTSGDPSVSTDLTNAYYFPITGGYTVCLVRDKNQAAISLGVNNSKLTVRTTIGSC